MKPTRDNTGAYLEMTLKVMEPPYQNRQLFYRLNLKNNNPVAQEIAYKQLSAICHAVGVLQVEDSAQLHGLPFKVRATIRKDDSGKYDPTNEIKSVKSVNEQGSTPALSTAAATNVAPAWVSSPGIGGSSPSVAASAAPAAGSLPPWLQAKA